MFTHDGVFCGLVRVTCSGVRGKRRQVRATTALSERFPPVFFSFFSLLVFLDSFSTRLPHGPAPKGRKEEVLASRWISKTGHWYPRRASSSWPILPRASPLFLTLIRFAGGFPTAASAGFFRFLPDLIPFRQVSVGFTWWDLQDYIFFSRTFSYIFINTNKVWLLLGLTAFHFIDRRVLPRAWFWWEEMLMVTDLHQLISIIIW